MRRKKVEKLKLLNLFLKRHRKELKRRSKRKHKYSVQYRKKIDVDLLKTRTSDDYFKFIKKNNFINAVSKKRTYNFKVPSNFDLINNPEEVLNFIKQLNGLSQFNAPVKVYLDFSQVKTLELGALLLQNVTVLNLLRLGIDIEGNEPSKSNYEAYEVFIHSGLYKTLGLRISKSFKKIKPITFDMHGNGKNIPKIPLKSIVVGKIETQITEYFTKCLNRKGFDLKHSGKKSFDHIISEVISNCREHSGDFNQYFCIGHFHEYSEGLGKYQLSIFNFGQSISDGLRNNELPIDVKERLEELINLHSKKGWFKESWNEETLLTLYSLQDRVSRVYDEKKTRGTGTIRLIKAFNDIGGTNQEDMCTRMTIISGRSQIIFDSSDLCKLNEKRHITFNETKTLDDPPSKKYVRLLEQSFPGTIITLSVYLDRDWIIQEKERMGTDE